MIKLVKDVMVEKKWIADERKEIEGRKEEYMRRWRELWNSLSEEKRDMFAAGEVSDDDADRLKIQELKRWYLGDKLYEKLRGFEREDDNVSDYCVCWCVGECCLCYDLDYWDGLEKEEKELYDEDVRMLVDNIVDRD